MLDECWTSCDPNRAQKGPKFGPNSPRLSRLSVGCIFPLYWPPLSVPLSLSRRRRLSSVALYLLSRVSCLSCAASPQGARHAVQYATRFRPCIDIHKGKVKQIVGSTLRDSSENGNSSLVTNFESDKSAAYYANMYKRDSLTGGHVIMLGADPLSQVAALEALHAYPGGLHVGGGINLENAMKYLDEGASHVIVTSYVFSDGKMNMERLQGLVDLIGRKRLVLDLSCREKVHQVFEWQKFSDVFLDAQSLEFLASYADEFLVHGVDVEGKRLGIDEELVTLLGSLSPIPVTYAGGVSKMEDLERIKTAGRGRVDVTVGSSLDIFGGDLSYQKVVAWHNEQIMVNI
ncbi:1-(5-phosphoribosyl)-5-[(5-phosphoribosylamino)methylideneamino] imidazole-4-carboxamide isomerase [Carex littledalei]|uniref:1-(5-phosphoribosyl)-5-[(5-phosphoribosylamino)methylideneamino] imidazole-4-carboxamide isomerase HISN3, chloroplastic n=1 Tax=Carex littledalei TaxID=544730 RepID=A0A833RC56_9POAL|nr:1-(5-phosphoribosyl)-5-[(5-phosphoribosylamino)methylideneamino] imidazole-4-carboxamide isomerase [Carex littledalei]